MNLKPAMENSADDAENAEDAEEEGFRFPTWKSLPHPMNERFSFHKLRALRVLCVFRGSCCRFLG